MGRIVVSLVVLFLIIGGALVYQATRGTSSLVLMPSELIAHGTQSNLPRIRVAGRVVEPVKYEVEPNLVLSFQVEDPKDPKGAVPVVYRGVKPDMFIAGRDVIIDGDYESGTIKAVKVLTQCPSKYEPVKAPGHEEKGPGDVAPKLGVAK